MTRLLDCCFAVILVLASLPTSYAQWSASAKVINDCFETIEVTIEGSTYTLTPGEEVYHTLCDSYCTAIFGFCKDYPWSYSASVSDPAYDYTWEGSRSDEVCAIGDGQPKDVVNLICPDMEVSDPVCQCCADYTDADYCCDYSDCPTPEPDPPAPVPTPPVPVPVPIVPAPVPVVTPSPPAPVPVIPIGSISPLPVETPKPDSFADITFFVAGATSGTFDRSGFSTMLSEFTGIPTDWIEVNVAEENNGDGFVSRRRSFRRRRHLLRSLSQDTTSSGLLVQSRMYTETADDALNQVKTAVSTGQAQAKLAAGNNKISSIAVNTASSSSSSSSNVGAIVGGVVGGVAAAALVAGGFAIAYNRRQKRTPATTDGAPAPAEANRAVQQDDPNNSVILNPPTMPSNAPISPSSSRREPSSRRVPSSRRSSGLRGLLQNQSSLPPTLPSVDPLMSWVTEQLASNPPIRSNILDGPYEIQFSQLQVERPIGEGSFGRVYAGKFNNTAVAIKVLLEASSGRVNDPLLANSAITASSPIMVKLHDEVKIMSAMDNPFVVKFIGVCSMPPCIVTELCAEGSLSDVIKKAASNPAQLPWRRRLAMAIDAAEGMRYLHSQTPPIIHRDLKSANMLVTADFRVKICDFNLSKILDDSTKSSSLAAMNPRWLAPCLFAGARGSAASDVFAFGVVLWELLCLSVPWGTTNPWQVVATVQAGGRLSIPERNQLHAGAPMTAACYAGYVRLITRCWAQVPGERPDIGRVSEELRTLAARDV